MKKTLSNSVVGGFYYNDAVHQIIKAGYRISDMVRDGFKIDMDSDKTPIEQAEEFNFAKSEAQY